MGRGVKGKELSKDDHRKGGKKHLFRAVRGGDMTFDAKVPVNLKETQKWFAGIITRPIDEDSHMNPISPAGIPMVEEAPLYIAPSHTLQPAQRIELYNQQYWWRLLNTLQEVYPLVLRLFGYHDFNQSIGIPYLVKYPPCHWSLVVLGDYLPQWVQEEYRASDRQLILDATKIDHAFNACFIAPAFEKINDVGNAEALLSQTLYLQPYVQLFSMDYHLFQFRKEFLLQEPEYWIENDFPKLARERTYYFVLYRNRNNDLCWNEISEGEYRLLSQFRQGTSIDNACQWLEWQSGTLYEEAHKHLHLWFQEWTARGWLTDLTNRISLSF
jgi:hypothetical protein